MKKFVFFSFVLVILFVVFVLDIFLNSGGQLKQNVKSTSTTFVNHEDVGAVSAISKPSKSGQIELNKDSALGNLVSKLPYTGRYFYFVYDFPKGSFVLTLDKNNITQGNSNFDAFLRNNGIQDRSWFINLSVVYQ